jgi:hypothetical protein
LAACAVVFLEERSMGIFANRVARVLLVVFSAALFVSGCSGGVSDGGAAEDLSGSGNATIKTVTYGRVTAVGTGITVSGVRYDQSAASYSDDQGSTLRGDEIALGMIVALEGDIDSSGVRGVARKVVVVDDIVAPLVAVDLVARTVTVAGARAQLTSTTVLVGFTSLEALATHAGELVVLHGPMADSGVIGATRVELRGAALAGRWFKGRGVVRRLDRNLTDFEMGPEGAVARVCYCHSLRNPAEPAIGEGRMIRIWALTSPVVGAAQLWVSDQARVIGIPAVANNVHVELDGIWTANAGTSGQIGDYPVDLSALSADRMVQPIAGQAIAVKGTWFNGRVVATRATL